MDIQTEDEDTGIGTEKQEGLAVVVSTAQRDNDYNFNNKKYTHYGQS